MFYVQPNTAFFEEQPEFPFEVECLTKDWQVVTDSEGFSKYEKVMAVDRQDARQRFEKAFPQYRAGNII